MYLLACTQGVSRLCQQQVSAAYARLEQTVNIVEQHRHAVEYANLLTWQKFRKHGPYTPNTPENNYWLERYDEYMADPFYKVIYTAKMED